MASPIAGADASKIKVVFTDMDGTVLDEQSKISPLTAETLQRMHTERDVKLVVATGRPFADAHPKFAKSGLKPDFFITCNGSCIYNGEQQQVQEKNLDPALVHELVRLRIGSRNKFATNLYRGMEWIADLELPEIVPGFDPSFVCQNIGERLRDFTLDDCAHVQQIWFLGHPDDLAPLHAHLAEHMDGRARFTYSIPTIIDVVAPCTHKGDAVLRVTEALGIKNVKEATVAFGDGMNDETMLQTVGHPFIMGNAGAALRAAVPHAEVIKSNEEEGVACKVRELFNL
ncbi:haloacid dehalogenase-like hydrolase [Strigomonas culicis]|uniref:Haloacid dehalogenase-like hydrolase n=1 Tax=Strigomonas culicis TaxID=28005 RepID=S9V4S9_9TRYP|nr:haloacid dehalogenase-like hydrolase [Strigomonas culicis]|eukprot:EPY36044.1 haloacid dehalogenase-like hydrolase [Strigomonas culicis]